MLREAAGFLSDLLLLYAFKFWEFKLLPFIWSINGVGRKLAEIKSEIETDKRAQVLDIWFRIPRPFRTKSANFILSHNQFVAVKDVNWKKAYLYRVSEKDAIVEVIEFDEVIEPFRVRKYPIFHMVQNDKAKRLLRLPISDFTQLGRSLKLENEQVVWMLQSLRCGSTAWVQAIATVSSWVCISETQPFQEMLETYKGDLDEYTKSESFKDIVEAGFRMCLYQHGTDSVFIKCGLFDQYFIPMIIERFPKHIILYGYRNPLAAGISFYKGFNVKVLDFTCKLVKRNPKSTNEMALSLKNAFTANYALCHKAIDQEIVPHDLCEWYVMGWCAMTDYIIKWQQKGVKISGVKYEKLQSDQYRSIESLFRHVGIDDTHIEEAQKALKIDSQVGLFFSQESRKSNKNWKRTQSGVERANRILNYFGFPHPDQDYIFPETL